MKLLFELGPIIQGSKYTKTNPYEVELPSGRIYPVVNSSYKTFVSVLVRNFNSACKGRQATSTKRGIGFDRPAVFDKKVVDYFARTLSKVLGSDVVLPSFCEFIPGTTTKNPTYRLIRHSSMTKIFDLCSKINNLVIPDIPNVVYRGDDEFKTIFAEAIQAAKEKDRLKGRVDADAETLQNSFTESKKLKGYMFNPDFFTHAQQSKIIETSKSNVVVIDDLSEEIGSEAFKKLHERAHQLKDEGQRVILVSQRNGMADKSGMLKAFEADDLYDLWDKQAETLNQIRTQLQ